MAVYKSKFKGSQVDEAVTIANSNKNKGSNDTPIYYDSEGLGQAVQKDSTATVSSVKPLTSGGAYTGLEAVVANSDIQTSTSLGTSGMPPSQGAVKQYVDNSLPAKQDTLYGGYGIDVNGATVSVSDDVFREDEEARLHADLKVDHFGDMSIGNDSEVLELMNEAIHSSFDRSKFTVVGSPIITDDGVASGLQANNFISCNNIDISKETVFHFSYNMLSKTQPSSCYLICLHSPNIVVYIGPTGGISLYKGSTYGTSISSNSYDIGQLDFKLTVNSTSAVCELYQGGVLKGTASVSYTAATFTTTQVKFGVAAETQYGGLLNAELDLKQFSITVDGVEVFSGNKTGIDTIKPDDYTVVGSNVIVSPSGIASGFNSTSYLLSNTFSIKGTDTLKYEIKVLLPSSVSGTMDVLEAKTTDNLMFTRLFIQADNTLTLYAYDGTTNGSVDAGASYSGKEVYIRCTVSNVLRKIEVSLDGENWTSYQSTTVMAWSGTDNDYQFNIGWYGSDNYFINPIDLNTFKIYINDSLVAQPLLKVPYTLTKDGKKIVDAYYRSRVEDEYTQAGYTPYYTLSDTDYTMATVEEDDIVASLDGATGYTQRADLSIEQQGTTTNGTTVTFLKAFMDTNYALSIPYSAKTKTGFTAAADGDYIAEGYTSL